MLLRLLFCCFFVVVANLVAIANVASADAVVVGSVATESYKVIDLAISFIELSNGHHYIFL